MNAPAIEFENVRKAYRLFALDDVSFRLEQGQIMGFVGPNGAGKSTTIRILMALIRQDAGDVRVLGHSMPKEQVAAKWGIGFVSDDMRLFGSATLAWHMSFVKSIYPGWDDGYAKALLKRFCLRPVPSRRSGASHTASARRRCCSSCSPAARNSSCSTSRRRAWTRLRATRRSPSSWKC